MKQNYMVLHVHYYGVSPYQILTDKEVTEELIIEHVLSEDYSPEKGESLEWFCLDDDEVIEL
jgi:hypothetical protein